MKIYKYLNAHKKFPAVIAVIFLGAVASAALVNDDYAGLFFVVHVAELHDELGTLYYAHAQTSSSPSASLSTAVDGPTDKTTIPFTVKFDKFVTGFGSGDITASSGTVADVKPSVELVKQIKRNTMLKPYDIAINGSGYVYVVDTSHAVVHIFDPDYEWIGHFGPRIGAGSGPDRFDEPHGISINSTGYVYVADSDNNRIKIHAPDGTFVESFGTKGNDTGEFRNPHDVVVTADRIYVSERDNSRVQVFDTSWNFLHTLGPSDQDNPNALLSPTGVAVNSAGNVYVADPSRNMISVFSSTGDYITKFGDRNEIRFPDGLHIDDVGNIYLANTFANSIDVYKPNHRFWYSIEDSFGTEKTFNGPRGVTTDSEGRIHVAGGFDKSVRLYESGYAFNVKNVASGQLQVSINAGAVQDSAGNANTASNIVDLTIGMKSDTQPPSIASTPAGPFMADNTLTTVSIPLPAVSDDRDAQADIVIRTNVSGIWKQETAAVSYAFGVGTHTIHWSATDMAGHTSNTTQTISIQDREDPVISPMSDRSITSELPLTVTYTAPSADDNVDQNVMVTCLPSSGSSFTKPSTEVTCRAQDRAGNHAIPVKFNVIITAPPDTEAPTINPSIIGSIDADGARTTVTIPLPAVSDTMDASDDIVIRTNVSGIWKQETAAVSHTFGVGTHTIHWSATDMSENTANATQTISIQDREDPVISPMSDRSITSELPLTVTYTAPSADDNVDQNVMVTCLPSSGSSFTKPSTEVTCRAQDRAGNHAIPVKFNVIITAPPDTEAPTINPSIIGSIDADGARTTVTIPLPAVSDTMDESDDIVIRTNVSGIWRQVSSDVSHTFGVGTHTIHWSATDRSGNTANDVQIISIQDRENPVISKMSDQTITGDRPLRVTYTEPSVRDNVDPSPVVTCTPSSGSYFTQPSTEVTCRAQDRAGNHAIPVTFDVIITAPPDTEAPTINPSIIGSIDADSVTTTVSIPLPAVSDTMDESDDIVIRTNVSGIWRQVSSDVSQTFGVGTHTIHWSATDRSENTANATQTISIQDREDPVISPMSDRSITGELPLTVTYTAPSATDNVNQDVVVSCTPESGSMFAQFSTEITCNAQDTAGNHAIPVKFNVIINAPPDTEAPTITTSIIGSIEADGVTTIVNIPLPTVSDKVDAQDDIIIRTNVSGIWRQVSSDVSHTFGVGTHTIHWSATDKSGHTANATQTISIQDNQRPVIDPMSDLSITDDLPLTVTYTAPSADDNVDQDVVASCTPESGSVFTQLSTEITCNAQDTAGNHAIPVTFNVIVMPPPVVQEETVSEAPPTRTVAADIILNDVSSGRFTYLSDERIDSLSTITIAARPAFDMANGNAAFDVILPVIGSWIHEAVSPHYADPSLVLRYVTLLMNAGYDATAPYDEHAVGMYSRIDNRPSSEYADSQNINTASLHAAYHLAMAFDPAREAQWQTMLVPNGLDPDDKRGLDLQCGQTHALTSAVAIGNLAAKCVLEGRHADGFNHFGDKTPGYPFRDTTGYVPPNSANKLTNASEWQPQILRMGDGKYVTQQFITPQWANTEPYSQVDPRSVRADAPAKSNHENMPEYKEQADEVLRAVAGLDDRKKMIAEYFDNNAQNTLFFPEIEALPNTQDFWQLGFSLHMAQFDAGIISWQEKARYDAVRPITAIHYIYGNETVTTYDKKDGSPRTIPGDQWTPYLNTGNHPEYPSETACFCAAKAEAWKRHLGGSDVIPSVDGRPGFQGVLQAGSSVHEPGTTPSSNVTIHYATWSEYVSDCGESRIWGGVHFRDAVEASIEMCSAIGSQTFDYFQTLLDGTATLRTLAHEQAADALAASTDDTLGTDDMTPTDGTSTDNDMTPGDDMTHDNGTSTDNDMASGNDTSSTADLIAPTGMMFTAEEQQWLADNPVITMGYNPDWAPYESHNDRGELSGVTVSIAQRFSEISGSQFVQSDSIEAWEDNIEGIRNNEIDLVFTAWAERSPSRESFMDFTSVWHMIPTDVVIRESDRGTIDTGNWHQYRVVVANGYAVDAWLAENMPDLEYVTADTPLQAINMIINSEADVYLEPWDIANHLALRYGISGLANAGPMGDNYELVIGYAEEAHILGSILQKIVDELEDETPQIISDAISRSYADLRPSVCR